MACGKPVVATNVGANPEEVEHEVTGLLVPPANHDALAEAIICLLEDESRRNQMGKAGRSRVKQLFNIQKQSQALASIYDDLIPAR